MLKCTLNDGQNGGVQRRLYVSMGSSLSRSVRCAGDRFLEEKRDSHKCQHAQHCQKTSLLCCGDSSTVHGQGRDTGEAAMIGIEHVHVSDVRVGYQQCAGGHASASRQSLTTEAKRSVALLDCPRERVRVCQHATTDRSTVCG